MKWYLDSGNEGDVVISSRIRLARNIKGFPFANLLTDEQSKKILALIKDAATGLNLRYLSMASMPEVNRRMLVERHIISPEMLRNTQRRAVLLSDDEQISVLLGEEDHIRIQCMTAGLDLWRALDLANKVDDVLEEKLDYGFDPRYGYKTCCPTNTGTGLRASCMLHLPALTASGYIETLLSSAAKLGMTVRGLYGEGSGAGGNMYQISNQITLGISESESVKRLEDLVKVVIEKERGMRDTLRRENDDKLVDMVSRSAGILKSACLLSSEEAYNLLSDVRLGINMGIIKDIPIEAVNELTITTGVAHIAELCSEDTPSSRDKKRAEIVKKRLIKH
ncbi:MAG: putative ATP:guanido phosphotransferase [Firmicutes bacterium ADurb.Bin193]|nr:MAG: putative ATP:guanido phosphotransferase [Firmicutes bacterium ADurb.Bin193]